LSTVIDGIFLFLLLCALWQLCATAEGRPRTRYGPGWSALSQQVKARDGYRCRDCGRGGSPGSPLHAHHLYARAKGGPDSMNNLITLCRRCHGRRHGRRL
jgi:5-methylcytosine-specific restriction endonuclease McrA